jgi:uncharacterized protein (DUF2141 family)
LKPSIRTATIASLIAASCAGSPAARADGETACAGNPAPNQGALHVTVGGMRSAKGNITITIYPDDAAHFLDGKYKVARQTLPVAFPVTTACFLLPAPAVYAVALFHDENADGHLDTSAIGIPTEGYGFSNNPILYFGPPGLGKVRFTLHPGDNSVDVRMKYY